MGRNKSLKFTKKYKVYKKATLRDRIALNHIYSTIIYILASALKILFFCHTINNFFTN